MGLIWANCFAGVGFAAIGGQSEKLITLCNRQGIPLYAVRPTADGFTAHLPARRYREALNKVFPPPLLLQEKV